MRTVSTSAFRRPRRYLTAVFRAHARLSEDRQRIELLFEFNRSVIHDLKEEGLARWSPSKRIWTAALDLTTAERLREVMGAGLSLSPELVRWGRAERRRRARLNRVAKAKDAELVRVPELLPDLAALLAGRTYQRADIARLALDNAINANEPGTGKSFEIIGAAAEADVLDKPMLIFAPVRAIENTWAEELAKAGYPHPVFASEDPAARKDMINWCWTIWKDSRDPFCLVLNPDIIRVKPAKDGDRIVTRDPLSGDPYTANQWTERLLDIELGLCAIDEFHKFGLTNQRSQFGLAARLLRAERMILASGTPMGGKFKRLWAALNWLHPDKYPSWWRWARQWLVVTNNGFGKVVEDRIQPGREEAFQEAHAHHFLNRTKLADLPGCPPKVYRTISCRMTKPQERQYREFEREAELRINGKRVTGHGILAEWSRLRAFANAACRVRGGRLIAMADSGKLPVLLDVLDEIGVRARQPEPGARAIVGSVDKSFVKIVAAYLEVNGIECGVLTGETKDSKPLIKRFREQAGAPYVIVMTIQTGGVSLNLEEAKAIVALDESWDPDDMTQFFERGDRGSRTTPLLCVTLRTRDTIQEYIAEVAGGKAINNRNAYKFLPRVRERASRASS